MRAIHKNYYLACIVIIALLTSWKLPLANDFNQPNKRETGALAQLTVTCSPEKPAVEPGEIIQVRAFANSQDNKSLHYTWSATAGKIVGQGTDVRWDFTGVIPGSYQATVQVEDSTGRSASCSIQVILRLPIGTRDVLRETGRSLLVQDKKEEEGYSLYSYLLFGSPPSDANRERYRDAIDSYLKLIPDVTILEKYIPPNELNITYLPVDSYPEKVISVDWVLEHYDYARALLLLRVLPEKYRKGNLRKGPYFISALEPLTEKTTLSSQCLFQDLSTVPEDKNIVSLWVKEFLNQAAQERFWERNKAKMFVIKLRTTIGILAKGLPDVLNGLKDWIAWTS